MFCHRCNAQLQLLIWIYLRITISHLLVCFPTLELTTFNQKVCSTKIGYANALSLGKNSCKKRNAVILNSATQIKQTSSVTCVVGENDSRVVCIASSESCQSIRDLFGAGTKLKESALKNNNQVNSKVTTRT